MNELNILKPFTHLSLAVMWNDFREGWTGKSNFSKSKQIENIDKCRQNITFHGAFSYGLEYFIFDGSTLTFYMSDIHLMNHCKSKIKDYIKIETLDLQAITFIVGLPKFEQKEAQND